MSRVLIVGGGLAGLTAAVALGRRGIRSDIVEITASGAPVGASITIWGGALKALDDLELMQACRRAGATEFLVPSNFDAAGVAIGQIPPGGHRPMPSIGMYRPVLAELLSAKVRELGANIHYGLSIQGLQQQPESVLVTFTDGSEAQYDLVVGADGIGSKVRDLAFGSAVKPQYAGQICIRWMAEGPPIDGPKMLYHSPICKLLSYDLPQENLIYVAVVSDEKDHVRASETEARARLASQLQSFTAPYVRTLAQRLRPDSKVIYRPFEWLLVPRPWHRGRVVLIGDAAHATTAQLASGGGMAIEDAVVLAQCLAGAADVPMALERFIDRRYERVAFVVETSLKLSRLEQQHAPPDAIRGPLMAAIQRLGAPY